MQIEFYRIFFVVFVKYYNTNFYLADIIFSFNFSVNSTSSTSSTKYDPDLLKSDVHHARARVQRLKRELANIHSEMDYKQRGVETLQR